MSNVFTSYKSKFLVCTQQSGENKPVNKHTVLHDISRKWNALDQHKYISDKDIRFYYIVYSSGQN